MNYFCVTFNMRNFFQIKSSKLQRDLRDFLCARHFLRLILSKHSVNKLSAHENSVSLFYETAKSFIHIIGQKFNLCVSCINLKVLRGNSCENFKVIQGHLLNSFKIKSSFKIKRRKEGEGGKLIPLEKL